MLFIFYEFEIKKIKIFLKFRLFFY